MCLAIPGKLVEIALDAQGVRMGKANFGGIVKQVCLEYTPEAVLGDYVLVHVGFALSKVDEAEAARTYKALEELQQLGELDVPDVDDPDADPFPKSPPAFDRPLRKSFKCILTPALSQGGKGSSFSRTGEGQDGVEFHYF